MANGRGNIIGLLLILVLFSGWSSGDKTLWGLYTVGWGADFGQTRYASKTDYMYETGPASLVLGDKPTTVEVNRFFIASYVSAYLVADALGENWRGPFLSILSSCHFYSVGQNHEVGVKFDFNF